MQNDQILMATGLTKLMTQIQGDWVALLQSRFTPSAAEPLSISILPQAKARVVTRNLLKARGSSDDVLASLAAKVRA